MRDGRITFATESRMLATNGQPLCTLQSQFTVGVRPAGYLLIWDAVSHADQREVVFGDQEEMGFGVRVATPITEKNGTLIIKPPSRTLGNERLGTLANGAAITTLAVSGPGVLSVVSARAQSPTPATGEQTQAKGRMEILHQRHDYRDPALQIDLTREGSADRTYFGSDAAKKALVVFRETGVPRLIGEPRLRAGTNRVYKNRRPFPQLS